ncbi:MAG TPA: NADAR family protein [Hyphomonadaceae bacterium]|nr:NADAR family protein [Hyphomonadaceae bacterium]HPN06072.1 NADAR family protein [Hyphomonadaceae bacterium]
MKGPFSQFHPSHFTLGGHTYVCAEQYMHEQKARLFGDVTMAERILKSDSPHEHKLMGGRVAGFDQQTWDASKIRIVTNGTRAKFGQNAGLRRRLIDTGDAILAEANPKDYIWGIGLSEDDPAALDPGKWQGENLLGQILMAVRSELAATSSV